MVAMQPKQIQERKSVLTEEDSLQFLWALSYSDLLMVLMSFFVIYFNFSSSTGELKASDPLTQISLAFGSRKPTAITEGASGADGVGIGDGGIPDAAAPATSPLIHTLAKALRSSGLKITVGSDARSLVLNYEDGFFDRGAYELSDMSLSRLRSSFEIIGQFKKSIKLTFIGHADQLPIRGASGKIINSNLRLSNLRAARAAEYAGAWGFDPAWVWAQGVGQFQRNTRSLSVRVESRLEAQP